MYGDGSELWVLERAGIERADLVIAVTGDDEDNILISQVAREKYGVERVVARCNNPRNLQHFELLGVKPAISATDLILRLIEHEVPKYGLVHLLDLPEERLEIIELEVAEGSEAAGKHVRDLGLPEGSLVISILRDGGGFVPDRRLGRAGGRRGAAGARRGHRGARDRALHRAAWRPRPTVADRAVDHLLIGGGLAAGGCARWLREEGADGSVLIVGREPDPPYNRPPLTKGYLRGEEEREDVLYRPGRVLEGERRRAAHPDERDEARRGGARGHALHEGDRELRQGAARHRRQRRRLRVDGCDLDGHPLPARVRQLGRDPRRGRPRPSAWC